LKGRAKDSCRRPLESTEKHHPLPTLTLKGRAKD
jgi:hypothetical protein